MKAAMGATIGVAAILLAACLNGQAQAGPAVGAGAGEATILATGGSSDNKSDILWIVTKVKPVRGPERMVLAMYQVDPRGQGFSLKGARMLDGDLRCIDFQAGNKTPTVNEIIKALPPEEQAVLRPPQNP